MSIEGVDYAWSHPAPGALVTAGKHFVCRYLSHDPSKDVTTAEIAALHKLGIKVVLNWESTGTDSGRANGVADAHSAQALAHVLGADTAVIYFSMDFDPRPSGATAAILAYMEGVVSVLGKERAGLYTGYAGIHAYLNAGIGKYAWQTYAWSGGQWDIRAQLQQYHNDAVIGGVQVDLDRAVTADYGYIGQSNGLPAAVNHSTKELQRRLNAWGAHPPLVVDGSYGPLTAAAVKTFQNRFHINEVGAGPLTWAALEKTP